ncbi:MAG: hypothetical protein DRI46_02990 [Chloroflexi bacterium]|nr:MAG: hypothetical protein DRI46_02990 [Chloroflexota bacterium]
MNKAKTYIAVVFSLLVLGYVFLTMDWKQVWVTIRTIRIYWLLAALTFHLFTYVVRTLRFRFLLESNPGLFSILGATNLYGMYLYLMPAKTGEAALPILYKNHLQIPLTQSTAALLAARFLDLVMMALLLPVLLALQWSRLLLYLRLVIVLITLTVIIFWVILVYLLKNQESLDPLIRWSESARFSFLNRLGEIIIRVFHELGRIYDGKKLWPALLISAGIWLLVQNTLFCIISSLGFHVTLVQVIVVTLVMIPFTFVPLQGFANLGTYEISIVLAFALYGVPSEDSLNIAIGSHIIYIGFSFVLGLLGLIILQLSKLVQKAPD